MKRAIFIIILLNLVFGYCFAETKPQQDDWDKKHADEASVLLFSSMATELNKDGSYVDQFHIIKRIQNENGMSEGEIPFTYDNRRQVFRKIKAYITTSEGKKYRYKLIQDIDTSSEGNYSDLRKKIITMPNVVPGSIIDIEAEVFNRQAPLKKGEYFDGTGLLSDEPAKHEIISLTVPEGKPVYFKKINTNIEPQVIKEKGKITYKLEFKADETYDEALRREVFLPPLVDIVPYICVSTIKDWPTFVNLYWSLYQKNIISDSQIKQKAIELTKDKKTSEEKIEALAKYLYDNFRYVEMAFEEHGYIPHLPTEVFKNKFGDCKDQSTFLITMLKEIGIEAYPVLIRDEGAGDFSKLLPAPRVFNHMIVAAKVGEKTYFIDPLIDGYRANEIPYDLEGDYALIIDGKGGQALKLPYVDVSQKTGIVKYSVRLQPDGSAFETLNLTFNRNDSIAKRYVLLHQNEIDKKKFMDSLESYTKGGQILKYDVSGTGDIYSFLTSSVEIENRDYAKRYGRIMIFGNRSKDFISPFSLKERKYPLWLNGESKDITLSEYTIPKGFKIEYLPPDVNLKSDWLDISVNYKRSGRVIKQEIHTHYKQAFISVARYKEFKDFMLRATNELNECIIIKKNNWNAKDLWVKLKNPLSAIKSKLKPAF